jgi:5-methylcytosine-specific restriction endonuclease McrA
MSLNNFFAQLFPVNYSRYIKSASWKKKAAAARKRAGYRCQLCNRMLPLQVHHRTYERLGYELKGDLIALCARCHRRHHGRKS